MLETKTATGSTAPHMIQEPPFHQGNPLTPKNKQKPAHQSSQQTPMPTQPHGQEEQ